MSKQDKKKAVEGFGKRRFSPYYLEYVKMTSFGRFSNTIVGAFGPGLNVVYGPNEAGKTTVNELVKGVLFGWPAARGENNPYRPDTADRAGSLFFRYGGRSDVVELTRLKNSDEADPDSLILGDIDPDTYETMFALTSDELLRLDSHNEMTARLLTAGSGTHVSPAQALASIEGQIKELLSRSMHNADSIRSLQREKDRLGALKSEGMARADQLRSAEAKLVELKKRQETLDATIRDLDRRVEELRSHAARLESLDAEIESARAELVDTSGALEGLEPTAPEGDGSPNVTMSEEYRLRDEITDWEEGRSHLSHAVENARRDALKSQTDFEMSETDPNAEEKGRRAKKQRVLRVASALLIPLFVMFLGAYFFTHPQTFGGVSSLILSLLLFLAGLLLAAVGMVMGLKPSHLEEELAEERKKKEWVMLQDRKTLAVCEAALEDHDRRIREFLDENGLGAAEGSLRRARRLLDEAHEARHAREVANQNKQALAVKRTMLSRRLGDARAQRAELCRSEGIDENLAFEDLQRVLARTGDERSRTREVSLDTQRRIGEITQELSAARRDFDVDDVKLQESLVKTRLSEAHHRLAVLLLAKRSLESAISEWERKSQPEVYAHASRLLSQMTDGAWVQVRMNAEGYLEVVDGIMTPRAPHLLSLGTRQQLYLSLRIALLMAAENVGKALPVICDDILVNFDDRRRRQAVIALKELAARRQVIVFTCHPDVASLVRDVDPQSNLVEL